MSFVCVSGCHECTGCMACQTVPEWVEIRLADATKTIDSNGAHLNQVSELIEKISSILDDLRGAYEIALEDIPEGYEDSDEYSQLEHNIDLIDSALDSLADVESDVDSMI